MKAKTTINNPEVNENDKINKITIGIISKLEVMENEVYLESIEYSEDSNKITILMDKGDLNRGIIEIINYTDSFTIFARRKSSFYEINPKRLKNYKGDSERSIQLMVDDIDQVINSLCISFKVYSSPIVMALFRLPNIEFSYTK